MGCGVAWGVGSGLAVAWGAGVTAGCELGAGSPPRLSQYQVLVPKSITAGPMSQPAKNSAANSTAPPAIRFARWGPE